MAAHRTQPQRGTNQSNQYLDRKDPVLKQFLADISKFKVIKNSELVPLIISAQAGNREDRQKAIEGNYRLLVRIAKEFQSVNISINDLIQEGYIGLDEAVSKFNPEKNVPFAHFASWWIKMRILKYIWWNQTTVRIPETQRTGMYKLLKISTRFIAEAQRVPSITELLEASGLSEKMVKNYLNLFNAGDLQSSKNIDEMPDDAVPMDTAPLPDVDTDTHIIQEAVSNCLDTLRPKHQEFLRDCFGIGRPAVTVTEMARRCGSSAENIRQKKARLIHYLQENCWGDLAPYLDEINNKKI